MKTKNWTENTNLEVVRIDPLGLCIDRISEGGAVGVVQKEGDDFLLHEEEFLSEGVRPSPGDDLWLEVSCLWYHGAAVPVSRHTLSSHQTGPVLPAWPGLVKLPHNPLGSVRLQH